MSRMLSLGVWREKNMSRDEIIKLLDDLAVAGTNYDLAKRNLDKWEVMYEKLLNEFNDNIEKIEGDILSDNEFIKKVERVKDVFDSLGNK